MLVGRLGVEPSGARRLTVLQTAHAPYMTTAPMSGAAISRLVPPAGSRTRDHSVTNRVLYRLSYGGGSCAQLYT